MLKTEEVIRQSKVAFKQWDTLWRDHAKRNGKLYKQDGRTQKELMGIGVGKTLVCVGMGSSLEADLPTIKKYKNKIEIACVDKAFGVLLYAGIVPNFVFVADAQVSYEKYCEPYLEYSHQITLVSNVTANPLWTENWKGKRYFYTNKDNIDTEKIYGGISGCTEMIPASSNVGNSIIVFSSQLFGYDKYLLTGYDFCWSKRSNYYAFDSGDVNHGGKRYWMAHTMGVGRCGSLLSTSANLQFSSKWLDDFYVGRLQKAGISLLNCSSPTISQLPYAKMEYQLKTIEKKQRLLNHAEKSNLARQHSRTESLKGPEIAGKLQETLKIKNILQIDVTYLPSEVGEWLATV